MTSEERPEIIRWLEDIRKCADKNHEIKSELAARYVNDERPSPDRLQRRQSG